MPVIAKQIYDDGKCYSVAAYGVAEYTHKDYIKR
jgi:hypothetical protein